MSSSVGQYNGYKGNDKDVLFEVTIYNGESPYNSGALARGKVKVTFKNGVASGAIEYIVSFVMD